jgi:hypothetical protein
MKIPIAGNQRSSSTWAQAFTAVLRMAGDSSEFGDQPVEAITKSDNLQPLEFGTQRLYQFTQRNGIGCRSTTDNKNNDLQICP